MTADPSPQVRGRAAVALARAGDLPRARAILDALLADPSIESRLAGLQPCSEVEGAASSPRLIAALKDGPPRLRLEAARALRQAPTEETRAALLGALDDSEPSVRHAAGRSLRGMGEFESLLPVLDGGSSRAQEEVIAALAGRPGRARQAVLEWAAHEMAAAEQLRTWTSALSAGQGSPAITGLRTTLALAEEKVEKRVLHGLRSAGSSEAIRIVARGLRSRDRDLRSQAVEALESIADRRVGRGLVRLLEADSAPASPEAAGRAVVDLTHHPRPWFRALAFRARAEQNQGAWAEAASLAADDPSPIVRQAVTRLELAASGDHAMETGQTLGVVERVLFLREVPIFRLLEPEDLEQIANLAGERLHPVG
jgi:HEAT repeat protein